MGWVLAEPLVRPPPSPPKRWLTTAWGGCWRSLGRAHPMRRLTTRAARPLKPHPKHNSHSIVRSGAD